MRSLRRLLPVAALAAALTLAGCSDDSSEAPASADAGAASGTVSATESPSVGEIREAIDSGATVIDVRTPDEFAAGHLEGAVNIPYDEIATRIGSVQPDRKAPIKLYCGIGVRAQMAKFSLEAQGYERVSNEGGYAAIVEAQAACRQDATKC